MQGKARAAAARDRNASQGHRSGIAGGCKRVRSVRERRHAAIALYAQQMIH
jgi:hypothetical protein